MKTYQERAEAYVRQQLPELMELSFGCEFKPKNSEGGHRKVIKVINEYSRGITYTTIYYVSHLAKETPASIGINDFEDMCQIIGHPIQPHHWLKVLRDNTDGDWMLKSSSTSYELVDMTGFNTKGFVNHYLILGHENFFKAFCEIVGVE